jgi:selenocysteine-specific elongation factor
MPVIGTAGHVDHGKSTLIHALTGIDPDRLREEKERGLTIDLGFAWLTLPSGLEVGVVDVPGHERFIKNMLAGAGGMDLALLIVAADEGPRPQTAEHLAILDLLEVPAGLVVLTKCDLVESDYADLVEAELEDTLRGSRLSGAPIIRVSAVAGTGLDELREAIDDALARLPARRDPGRPRVPIDRAFSIQGFGTVVTGTLTDGWIRAGDEMELLPGGLKCRIRGLQRHRTKVEAAGPGTRVAVNLSGVHHDDLRRGMVLARPGSLTVAQSVVARLTGSRILGHPLQHDAEVTLLAATAQSQAKVRLLDAESLIPGQSCWAQLVLESPMAVLPGDHVVIRSPDETIGGGPVVSVNGRRLRRNDAGTIRSLELALSGAPEDRIFERLSFGPQPTVSLADGLAVDAGELDRLLSELGTAGSVVLAGDRAYSRAWLEGAELRLESEIDAFMAANPLRRAVPKEHLRRGLALTAPDFELVVGRLLADGRIEERGTGIARHGFEPALSAAQEAEVATFLRALAANPYSPPTDRLPPPPVLSYLVERGDVEDTGAGVVFARSVYEDMVARVREHFAANPTLSLAETRDLFGTSRKYAQAFLERLDALHVTRRVGDSRTLRS